MTRNEAISSLRKVLLKRRNALRNALAGDLSLLNDLRGETHGDVIDYALDAAQDEISSQLAEVESRELGHIENALVSMREGTYGNCGHCGESIPLARLQALPYATLCIRCQRESEKGGSRRPKGDWSRVVDASAVDADVMLSDIELDVR